MLAGKSFALCSLSLRFTLVVGTFCLTRDIRSASRAARETISLIDTSWRLASREQIARVPNSRRSKPRSPKPAEPCLAICERKTGNVSRESFVISTTLVCCLMNPNSLCFVFVAAASLEVGWRQKRVARICKQAAHCSSIRGTRRSPFRF